MTSSIPPDVVAAFAPTGVLRASINLGNPILAGRHAGTGEPTGVSVDLARALAERLGVASELLLFEKAAASVDTVRSDRADIGFFAIDPARSEGLHFTAPYVLIEGSYLVPGASALRDNGTVDAAGTRIAVGSGSAYDLFLTRALHHAHIERLAGAADVIRALEQGDVHVAAGIRQVLEAELPTHPDWRLLPGRFMVIQQAMGLPASRGQAAAAVLAGFAEEMKRSGFVGEALARHGVKGASVAPAAGP